ncbi:dihydrodipicolinate synthase family protein [Pseudonocardia nematodicida]|uniref:Dihydrodipicolinate synthase family protein n=1 Tax=Pseudonocardia nematodicida TaxID=1206997 RepID=A0ABV1KJZ5_9PSEU
MATVDFTGIIPPIVTPFHDDETVDTEALRREVDHQLSAGVHGICVTGTTGEGQTLSVTDSTEVARTVVEHVGGRVPVMAGIIQNSTRACVEYGRALADVGVDGLQVTPVHYLFQPGQDEIIGHYRAVTEETGKPVIIYNVVPWAMVDVPTLVRMVTDVPAVVAVKQSGGDLHKVADLLAALDGAPTRVLSAVDDLLYPSFTLGAHGSVSGTSSLAPGLVVRLWEAVRAEDHATARELHRVMLPLWRSVEGANMPALIKECLRLQGRVVGVPRRPCDPPTPEQTERLRAAVSGAGLLAVAA